MPPPNLPPDVVARGRISALEEELEASDNDDRRSVLRYEVGALTERGLGDLQLAETHYRAAYNLNPGFAPPLLALQRIYAGQGRMPELDRVLSARIEHACHAPRARAAAMAERAALLAMLTWQPGGARAAATFEVAAPGGDPALLEQLLHSALESDPDCLDAGLLLEHHLLRTGQHDEAERALRARAAQVADPALKGAMLLSLAALAEKRADSERARALLQQAVELPHGRFAALSALSRVATRLGDPALSAECRRQQAQLAARFADGEDRAVEEDNEPLGRFGEPTAARPVAATLFREAAWLRAHAIEDGAGARADYRRARAYSDDPVIACESAASCGQASDHGALKEIVDSLVDRGVSGSDAAALHFRCAELASIGGEHDEALRSLRAAHAQRPGSPAVVAMLEHTLEDQQLEAELATHLKARAEREPEDAAELMLRAIELALHSDDANVRAQAEAWVNDLPTSDRKAREAGLLSRYRAALLTHAPADAWATSGALCEDAVDPRCAAFLRRVRFEVALAAPNNAERIRNELVAGLAQPACADWAPHAARAWAAQQGDHELLAHAHGVLAEAAADVGHGAAHHCAAARAWLRDGDAAAAENCLRKALQLAPGNAYAVALLEELLLARGETEGALELLRDNATTQADTRQAELSLLSAGMAAERADNLDDAARSYTQAAERARDPLSPYWALYRIAERTGNRTWRATALSGLSAREQRFAGGMLATLELAELQAAHGDATAERTGLRQALQHPETEVAAAFRILVSPADNGDVSDALHRLLVRCPDDAPSFWAEAIATRLDTSPGLPLPDELERVSDGAMGQLATWLASPKLSARARALTALSDGLATADDAGDTRAELHLQALRCQQLSQTGTGVDAPDGHGLRAAAKALLDKHPDSAAAAVALDEAAGADPEARALSLSARLAHSAPEQSSDLRLARARARLLEGDAAMALEEARALCNEASHDVACWELLRAAAHNEGDYATVVVADDHLAERAPASIKAALLHEAGRCLMEQLGDLAGAEQRLRLALDVDPHNEEAFSWLHDLLAQRGDAVALVELLCERLNLPMATEARADLLYEAAGIMRALGEHAAVLDTLGELLDLVPDHVGALGLLAESHACVRDYRGAVAALKKLARCPIPAAQKQLVQTGAADFLAEHLDDPAGAHDVLAELAADDLADATIYTRMGELSERAGRPADAAAAFERAAQLEAGRPRAELFKRAAEIHRDRLDDYHAARQAYEQALLAAPTDAAACGPLLEVLPTLEARDKYLVAFDRAIHLRLGAQPASAEGLRTLAQLGTWRQDSLMIYTAVDALVALELATPEERHARAALFAQLRPWPRKPLSADALQILRKDRDAGPAAELAALVSEAVSELRKPSARKLGLGRRQRLPEDHALVDELTAVCRVFSVEVATVYVGGEDVNGIRLLPEHSRAGTWVVGAGLETPLSPEARLLVGRQAFAQHAGVWPLFAQPKTSWRNLMLATAMATEPEAVPAETRGDLRTLTRKLNRHMPRALRRRLATVLPPPEGLWDGLNAYLQAAELSHLRAGLLLCGELQPALRQVLGDQSTFETIAHSVAALDLLRFWTSPKLLTLHRQGSHA